MRLPHALALLLLSSCANVPGATRWSGEWVGLGAVASANSADGAVRGAREEFLVRGHVENGSSVAQGLSITYLDSRDYRFTDEGGDTWDDVLGLATIAKWEQGFGPTSFGWGFELGWETQGFESSNPLFALIDTARVELGDDVGGWSLHADLHWRTPFFSDNNATPGGADPDHVFGGWVLFLGIGYSSFGAPDAYEAE